jgi:hypothetical protein
LLGLFDFWDFFDAEFSVFVDLEFTLKNAEIFSHCKISSVWGPFRNGGVFKDFQDNGFIGWINNFWMIL